MRDRISAILLGLLCIAFTRGYGQDIIGQSKLEYSSRLPDVAAIQKAIDIPVSPFTGQANISIPVYTLSSRSLSVPITLDYSTGGIRADQSAGAYGLGWSLNAGGCIARQIRGNEDEGLRFEMASHKYVDYSQTPNVTYYRWTSNRDSLINSNKIYGGFYIDSGARAESDSVLFTEFTRHDSSISAGNIASATATRFLYNGLVDGEPDVFYFKFGNYSGKFIFGVGRTPILVPYNQDLQISVDFRSRLDTVRALFTTDTTFYKMYYFNSFKIATPDGRDYYFGETESSKIYTPVLGKPNLYNGWQLTRIVDRNTADTIVFSYSGSTVTNAAALESKQQFIKNNGTCPANPVLQITTQSNVMGFLSTITGSNEQLQLQRNTIIAKDKSTGEAFRQFDFTYMTLPSQRAGLREFIIRDLKLNTFSLYGFEYYAGVSYGGTSAQDYWGYHNGVNNAGKLMLGYTGCYSDTANRRPAWPAMQLDALVGINYPTGGKTIIEYEQHDANTGRALDNSIATGSAYSIPYLSFSLPNTISGLRVRRIMRYDPISRDTLIARYIYKLFGTNTSSGYLYDPPALLTDYSSLGCGPGNLSPKYLRTAQSIYQGSGTGQHVSYNNVTVQEEKNGVTNGYIEYEYYNDTNTDSVFYSNSISETTRFPLNAQYNLFPTTQYKRLPENLLNGQEKEKRVYSRSGQLLEKTSLQYKGTYYAYVPATLFTCIYKKDACSINYQPGTAGTASDVVTGEWYYIDSSGNVAVGEGPNQINKGIRPILPPPYSFFYMYRYIAAKMSVRPSMIIKQSFETPTKYITDTTLFNYENTAHTRPTSIVTRSSKGDVLKQQTIYSYDCNPVNNGDSTIYFMQKAFLNVPLATFNYTNSNVTSGGYKSFRYRSRTDSTAFLLTDEYSLLTTQAGTPPATLNIATTYPKAFNFPSAYFQKTASIRYNPDNTISYAIKKGNDKTNLIWDYNRSFVVAQIAGADSSDIAFTSFESSGNGNWTVAGTGRDTVSFLTGKRSYNLTAGNITKSGLNGSKVYIVSYWSPTTAATVNSTAGVQGVTRNGWNYFEHKLPAGTTSVTISGSVKVDELRIFPAGAQMTSYCFNPMTGVTAADQPDNTINYYEYDGRARIRFIRDGDKNILKAASYFEPSFLGDTAVLRLTGRTVQQKCAADTNYYSQTFLDEEVDINMNSPTYNTTRWTRTETCSKCVIAVWKDMGVLRCQTDSAGNKSGYQLKQQSDSSACSSTYGQTRWVVNRMDLTACPVPGYCTAEDQRIINGSCVLGTKIITASGYNQSLGKWVYTYHWAWLPDCVTSGNYTGYSSTPISPGGSCTPQ